MAMSESDAVFNMAFNIKTNPDADCLAEDDKHTEIKEFEGATLQIGGQDNPQTPMPAERERSSVAPSHRDSSSRSRSSSTNGGDGAGGGLSRNRPGSVLGRTSVRSTSSRTSMRPNVLQTDMSARSYYCYKESQLEKAVNNVKHIIKPDLDGELKATWLLTEIDHWDFEREKIVLLTEYSIFIVKYNFINEQLYEYRRIMMQVITSIVVGDFKYPNSSLMPDRQHGGIKLSWGYGDTLSFGQRWNPWCTDIPWCILSHHPLIYNPKENETTTYNVDEFFESLVTQISKVYTEKRPGETLTVVEGPIVIESYASPLSMVFNQSSIGYFRDRNGVSF